MAEHPGTYLCVCRGVLGQECTQLLGTDTGSRQCMREWGDTQVASAATGATCGKEKIDSQAWRGQSAQRGDRLKRRCLVQAPLAEQALGRESLSRIQPRRRVGKRTRGAQYSTPVITQTTRVSVSPGLEIRWGSSPVIAKLSPGPSRKVCWPIFSSRVPAST